MDFNQISINKNDSLEDLDFKICLNCLNFHILGFGSSAVHGKMFLLSIISKNVLTLNATRCLTA